MIGKKFHHPFQTFDFIVWHERRRYWLPFDRQKKNKTTEAQEMKIA